MAVALPAIAVALTAVGTGVAAYGAVSQGQAAKEAGHFNAQVARNQATAEQQRADFEAQAVRRRNTIVAGQQRAAFAKAGVDLTGSAEDVIYDSAIQGEIDRMAALYGGATAAGYYRSRAKLSVFEGDQAASASYFNAGGTVLTGAARGVQTYNNAYINNPRF